MEKTTEKKSNSKSLYIYTTLIFAVAILMIVISFFGQINLDKKHESVTGETTSGSISERVAQLSDENRILIETSNSLSKQISEKDILISMLNDKIAALETQISDNDGLYRAFNYIKAKDKVSAEQELNLLKVYTFTTEQHIFYEYLKTEFAKL